MSTERTSPDRRPAPTTDEPRTAACSTRSIAATKQTERERAEDLLQHPDRGGAEGHGHLRQERRPQTINQAIEAIDEQLSEQLAAVMHHPEFQKLEGLLARAALPGHEHARPSAMLKIKVLNVSKRELFKDLDKAVEFDQSQIFKKIYENEFGTPGGEPYGALIGDYEFTNHPEDIELL